MHIEIKSAQAMERRSSEHTDLFQKIRRNRDNLSDSLRKGERRRWRIRLGRVAAMAGITMSLSACATNIGSSVNSPKYCDQTGAGNSIINSTLPRGIPKCPTLSPSSNTTISMDEVIQQQNDRIHARRKDWENIGEGVGAAAILGLAGRIAYNRRLRRRS